jgi:glycosyltransferase involved in cell wall biosynthesis
LLFIRNGIDKSLFLRALRREEVLREFGLDPARFHLLSVSRLKDWKRVERSIEILAALCRSDVDLIIVGDGDERARLERIARNHGVSERVYFLGAIERAQVAALMNVADIFLSLYDASNCGNPLFEALLCGRCIVTLDNGGTGEVIKDGWNGRLVSMGELHRLPVIVDQLIADSPARERLQQGAREWARREMRTWDERIAYEIDWLRSRLGLASST